MAQKIIQQEGAFASDQRNQINDNFTDLYGQAAESVKGPASATNNAVPLFDGTTGKLVKDGPVGVSVGPFTTITSITVVNGIVTDLQGS